jgi:4-hydroxy-3-polyprenylbenzoate decarboxylase
MGYRNLSDCLRDLERTGQLVRIDTEIDADQEAAEVQRRVYAAGGPALLFTRVKSSPFPLASNLFGTLDRARFLFRDSLDAVRKLVALKADPGQALRHPWRYRDLPFLLWRMRPRFVRRGPILTHTCSLAQLPGVKCWPRDGGPFITLPQVYTEHPDCPGWMKSNLGMYRVQLRGNDYDSEREVGLHYQIHRGIGVHHAAAIRRGERLPVAVIVGGPPALALAAVMPLPEGLPELAFAGLLGGRRLNLVKTDTLPIPAEADFVLLGHIDPTRTKPEGPFGDHLGYYSLTHDFPVMTVEKVFHRPGAVWPFTVVGRPPQEDTTFGELIHELTGPAIPSVIPGLHAVHAVDAAGVHPLLLAIGSERYVPYAGRRTPQELLTTANAILGQGQLSLAKYLFIAAKEDDPRLDIHDIAAFFRHILERVDWETDLHFQTRTTIDTLDYSAGMGLNAGSKLVVAAAGPKRRELGTMLPTNLHLPDGFNDPRLALPGVLVVPGPKAGGVELLCDSLASLSPEWPLVVVANDAEFTARTLNNFLWVVFTRSDPASDAHGVGEFVQKKHWGCRGPLVIDARLKPHMPLPLEPDPAVVRRVDALFARGGPLAGLET